MVTRVKSRISKTLFAAASIFLANSAYSQSIPSPMHRTIPDTPAYSPMPATKNSNSTNSPSQSETLLKIEHAASNFYQIEDYRSDSAFIKMIRSTSSRANNILEDRLNSEIPLWINEANINWNNAGANILEDAAIDAFKYAPIYHRAQTFTSILTEKSGFTYLAEKITFGFVRGLTFPFNKSEQWAEKASSEVSASFDLDIGSDQFSQPYIRQQDNIYPITFRPDAIIFGIGKTGKEKSVITKINPLGSLDLQMRKNMGEIRTFVGGKINGGIKIENLLLNHTDGSYWQLYAGAGNKYSDGFNLTTGISYKSYFNENEKNDLGAFAILSKGF